MFMIQSPKLTIRCMLHFLAKDSSQNAPFYKLGINLHHKLGSIQFR